MTTDYAFFHDRPADYYLGQSTAGVWPDRQRRWHVQALWPDAVQPLELWRTAYDSCWQAFVAGRHAAYGTQIPEFPSVPEPDMGIQTYLLGFDVMEFFRKISTLVPVTSLQYGLNVILEESFEDTASVFPEERGFLFSSLERLKAENIFPGLASL